MKAANFKVPNYKKELEPQPGDLVKTSKLSGLQHFGNKTERVGLVIDTYRSHRTMMIMWSKDGRLCCDTFLFPSKLMNTVWELTT